MSNESLAAEENPVTPEDLDEEDKVMLVFSYLWVLALVPFMVTRREYVRWHAKQGLILCGIACLVFFGVIFVGAILATLSKILGWLFGFALINLILLYMALANQTRDVAVGRVVRHAAHGRLVLRAAAP